MDKPMIEALGQRVDRLERENRRWRWGAACVLLAGLAVAAGGARRAEKVVEAERFVVKDEDGVTYAELGLYRNSDGRTSGATRLVFFDKNGRYRTNYGVGSGSDPYLHLMDRDGEMRAVLNTASNGWSSLSFTEKSGKTGVSIGSTNSSGVVLRGPGEQVGQLQHEGAFIVQADGSAVLHFFRPGAAAGTDRHERVRLGVNSDGLAGLTLRGLEDDSGIRAIVPPGLKPRLTVDGAGVP
jgi:hypothetical protein